MTRPCVNRASLGMRTDWPVDTRWGSEEEELFCKKTFTARYALSIIRNISSSDLENMGSMPSILIPNI